MVLHILTYATHSEGMFNQLINNKFNIPIKVIGYGTKWNGYIGKAKYIMSYLESLSDDDIVVILDGFDTVINKDIKYLIDHFISYKCKILISKDQELVGKYLSRKIFGDCGTHLANAGMYMGYVKNIKLLLTKIISMNDKDDQRCMNTLCKNNFDSIKIDSNKLIFENGVEDSNAIFSGFAMAQKNNINSKIQRYYRAVFDYYDRFLMEIMFTFILLIIVIFYLFSRRK